MAADLPGPGVERPARPELDRRGHGQHQPHGRPLAERRPDEGQEQEQRAGDGGDREAGAQGAELGLGPALLSRGLLLVSPVLCKWPRLVTRPRDGREQVSDAEAPGFVGDARLPVGQVGRGLGHPRRGKQRLLDRADAGGAVHPLDREADSGLLGRRRDRVARGLDGGGDSLSVELAAANRELAGRQIGAGLLDGVELAHGLLDPRDAGGAVHALDRELQPLRIGGSCGCPRHAGCLPDLLFTIKRNVRHCGPVPGGAGPALFRLRLDRASPRA